MTASRLFHRAVIRLSPETEGEDVQSFLQGLVTNDLRCPLPLYAGLLSPQGKTLFDFIVWPSGEQDYLLDCEAEAAEDLIKRLSLYRLRRKITIAVDPDIAVHWRPHLGDGAPSDPRLADLGERWLAPVDPHDIGADDAWLAHRLALGVPEGRAEMGDILWLETNAAELHGVAFDKGCYIGQENTARMNWRQKVNRRLVVVKLDRSDEKRRKAAHEALGYAIDHRRVDDIDVHSLPAWQKGAFTPAA